MKNNLPNKPKLRTYISFKEQYCTEDYVKLCISRKERSMLAQIKFGILILRIETVRFRGTALEEPVKYVNSQSIEDEFHFILICNGLNKLRINLFNNIK